MSVIRSTGAVAAVAALLLFGSVSALADAHEKGKPARVVSTVIQRVAIVEAVNKETRELKLLDAQGNRFTVVADGMVRNFDQIEPRDRIIADYLESVAVVVAPAGSEEPMIGSGGAVAVAPVGDMPAFEGVETRLVTGTVQSVNMAEREAVLLLEDGELRTVNVADDARLDLVEVGDEVRLRITHALAVAVVHPDE